jgi:hypothetical protein
VKAWANGPGLVYPLNTSAESATSQESETKDMPQSLSSILIHLIFSTKHRQPFITPKVEVDTSVHGFDFSSDEIPRVSTRRY